MTFHIALTGDFQKDGETIYPDFDLGQLKAADGIKYNFSISIEMVIPGNKIYLLFVIIVCVIGGWPKVYFVGPTCF